MKEWFGFISYGGSTGCEITNIFTCILSTLRLFFWLDGSADGYCCLTLWEKEGIGV